MNTYDGVPNPALERPGSQAAHRQRGLVAAGRSTRPLDRPHSLLVSGKEP